MSKRANEHLAVSNITESEVDVYWTLVLYQWRIARGKGQGEKVPREKIKESDQ
jgi:hypothetical protein